MQKETKKIKPKRAGFPLRLPDAAFKRKLYDFAILDGRSLNNFIVRVLEKEIITREAVARNKSKVVK